MQSKGKGSSMISEIMPLLELIRGDFHLPESPKVVEVASLGGVRGYHPQGDDTLGVCVGEHRPGKRREGEEWVVEPGSNFMSDPDPV